MSIRVPSNLAGTRFSTDLSNRQVDIFIAQGVDFTDGVEVNLAFADRERVVAGAQKLIQKWLIAFLTKLETVQADPNYGTEFMRKLQQGNIVNDADVRLEFSEAAARVADTLERTDAGNPNDDERLQLAELRSFTITKVELLMTVEITSQAGEGATVILPVPLEAA